jgi:diguanylate cyclase (GGDEF)-like protein
VLLRILIAEDETVSRRVLKTTLESWGHEVLDVCDGRAALEVLQTAGAPKLAILDLSMPEMDGITVCRRLREQADDERPVYIIMLTARSSKRDVVAGLGAGADDYVAKPFDGDELRARVEVGARVVGLQRSLAQRVAELEQALGQLREAQETLRNLSLTDDLTGLYNRRGFYALADQHLKTARRAGCGVSVVYADMDGLKAINDTHGHDEGSKALGRVADILRRTFRSSDIIARIGGDEFVVLEASAGGVERLRENLRRHNTEATGPYELSLSVGVFRCGPDDDPNVEEMLARADELMYEEKRRKRPGHGADRELTG